MAELTGKYFEGVGRRKTSVARVRLYPGEGAFVVNEKPFEQYFMRVADLSTVQAPLAATGMRDKYLVSVMVKGGGQAGQAGAVAHGVARALLKSDGALQPVLRKGGFLTRDARIKERKKPGLKRARKAPQYTKR
ncbi:MAG: 30S ribosomal protein S9 [Chloroflexi bacterium]|nr:30S ribosomal protein S9 [Chloroflexota bacterium]